MDAVLSTLLQVNRAGKKVQRLTAVAAYEDVSTETRVNEFCQGLTRQLGPTCEFTKQMWLLGELRVPQLRTIAAQEAASADVIIVSVHHADRLPAEVQSWIETWLEQKKRRATVLLALFDPPHYGISTAMRAYLKEVAQRCRMEFLVQAEETTADLC